MDKAIMLSITILRLNKHSYTKNNISMYSSFHLGSAMVMFLHNIPRDTIRKMGCWSCSTFLMYIHKQISAFATNINKIMSNDIVYMNVQSSTQQLQHFPIDTSLANSTLLYPSHAVILAQD